MIPYKLKSQPLPLFSDYLNHMIEAKGPNIIVGNLNIDAFLESRLSHSLASYSQFVDSSTHISELTLDHVYAKNGFQENSYIKVSKLNINCLDFFGS